MADSTGNEEALIVSPAPQPKDKTLKEKIEELWERKDAESTVLAEGRTMRSTEDRRRDALNWAFERLPVSLFPKPPRGEVIEISSDASVAEAITVLSHNGIWSAPVRSRNAPRDASWIDRYVGMLDYSGVVLWVLGVTEAAAAGLTAGATAAGSIAGTTAGLVGAAVAGATGVGAAVGVLAGAAAGAALGGSSMAYGPGRHGQVHANGRMTTARWRACVRACIRWECQVADIAGSFRWGPFLPVEPQDSLLTLMLLMAKYRMKSIPVVESLAPTISNYITQSAVVRLLAECDGLDWFDQVAGQSLAHLGLPRMKPEEVERVEEDRQVLESFQKMAMRGIGGIAVVAKGSARLVGNVSARDIRFLLESPELFGKRETMTVRNFIEGAKAPSGAVDYKFPVMSPPVTCSVADSLSAAIHKMNDVHIHRLYTVDGDGNLTGVVTLGDIIGKFVQEPAGYFASFFTGVAPPSTSTAF
eukprot:jgi/Mesen1/2692/ME000167S01840